MKLFRYVRCCASTCFGKCPRSCTGIYSWWPWYPQSDANEQSGGQYRSLQSAVSDCLQGNGRFGVAGGNHGRHSRQRYLLVSDIIPFKVISATHGNAIGLTTCSVWKYLFENCILQTQENNEILLLVSSRLRNEQQMYTYIGPVLVAINPFKLLSAPGRNGSLYDEVSCEDMVVRPPFLFEVKEIVSIAFIMMHLCASIRYTHLRSTKRAPKY